MPLTHVGRGTGVALAVDLVNSWDELDEPPELLQDAGWLPRYLAFHGYRRAAATVRDEDVPAARLLRERLTQVFDAPSEAGAVRLLNGLAAETATPPRLERAGGAWRFRYGPGEAEGMAFVAPLAVVGLLDAIRKDGFERFGRCAAAPCCCVYVDRTRNRSRRYCCEICANRAAQQASRARRRA